MKYLLMAAAAVLVFTGCHSNDYQGSPGDERYMENSNDRGLEGRTSDNMRSFGRYGSPTSPSLQGPGNGTGNF
jgi:hypothetical protein